ncbi:MAG TPA: hydroxymethylglutaryl-CoA lyase [Flexivirga sp.]|uniref:hydroxymethylglutaryl-CoA lyase n=1 Tax=Flexivirga sp. TaxID=1962927 RepID=UPI002C5DC6C0|nr:hydroxymethylglutaryl-CoA lyase [Flexivirga sp.]HWC24562.1 hydroxymethylglutaryl-CoA lyase [Flexivirga sp.]
MVVRLTDVVLRDGLQDLDGVVSTGTKVALARALVAAGVAELEVAAFVSPKWVPQMGDATAVLEGLADLASIRICAIALNGRGIQRARESHLDELRLVVSAANGHSQANAGRSPQQLLGQYADELRSAPVSFDVTGAVSVAFNCPFDGPVSAAQAVGVVSALVDLGATRVSLADTLGTASTAQVMETVTAVRNAFPDLPLGLHLHDGEGQALTTVTAAVDAGVDQFDSALGGLGGCPFAPGAHGNLDTADLVGLLEGEGIDTGIRPEGLAAARGVLQRALQEAGVSAAS